MPGGFRVLDRPRHSPRQPIARPSLSSRRVIITRVYSHLIPSVFKRWRPSDAPPPPISLVAVVAVAVAELPSPPLWDNAFPM
ncbi:hypothetical protein Y032_0030g2111 [Ancylostoma ceylanicum]|uniref:Uncharacterized protein n=1 Tax=Ancylostoma ceylanicum TaxID=53326 RepID=A0A016URV9_9BILA|nr:hypothetical protein Y032_0030g2111 [Ancylostoma ceylanicum]